MKLLSLTDRNTLYHRYVQSDLYRQWAPILSMLQRKFDEADPASLWYVAERQIVRLRGEQSFREQDIAPIYSELLSDCQKFDESTRSKEQARRTASTVMCIVLTMLMNAVEKGHEEERFDNEPMCMAVLDIFVKDTYFQGLMNLFFKRNTGYDGQNVVIAPDDPMLEKTLYEGMDDVAKEEIKQMVKTVMSHTQGLKAVFKSNWTHWESLWKDILADTKMLLMMKNIEPQRNDWGFNQKMVCNVVGMFRDKIGLSGSIKALNDAICTKNIRSYISNHADYDGNDSVFSREQHERIFQLIDKNALSTKSK